jgi:hypothetical protein
MTRFESDQRGRLPYAPAAAANNAAASLATPLAGLFEAVTKLLAEPDQTRLFR